MVRHGTWKDESGDGAEGGGIVVDLSMFDKYGLVVFEWEAEQIIQIETKTKKSCLPSHAPKNADTKSTNNC